MTIEEKAKAYDEALAIAKQVINNNCSEVEKLCLECALPELKESEDERIRKGLIHHLKELRSWKVGTMSPIKVAAHYDAWIAYLERQNDANKEYWRGYREGKQEILDKYAEIEKQKEQPPAECINFDNEFKNQVSHLLASVLNKEHDYTKDFVEYASQSLLGYAKNELKPAEWSEEDKNALNYIHELISFGFSKKFMDAQTAHDMREWLNTRLKSLRPQPHWKPSEYTLSLVKKVANGEMLTHMEQMAMETLCNDLQKLL